MEENTLEENTTAVNNTEESKTATPELNILSKSDEPKAKKPDYFKLRVTGKLPNDVEEQIRITKGEDLKLAPKEELWKDEEIKKSYTERYGNKAFDTFYEDYNNVQSGYNQFQFLIGGKSTKEAILKNESLTDEIEFFGVKQAGASPTFGLINKSETGSLDLFNIHTGDTQAKDKAAIDEGGFFDPATGQWRELKKPTTLQSLAAVALKVAGAAIPDLKTYEEAFSAGANFSPVNNPLYTDGKGNRITALEYVSGDKLKEEMLEIDPNSQYGEDVRGRPYMRAVYEGQELGDKQIVSTLDLYGITDPQLKVGTVRALASALPRAAINTSTGVLKGASSTLIALNDLTVAANNGLFDKGLDSHNAFRKYLKSVDDALNQANMSVSEESKSDMYTGENIYTGVANVATQLIGGFGLASVAGKAGSVIGMTSMAVANARDEAIAAGFSENETAVYMLGAIGAAASANKLFSWVDKRTVAGEFAEKMKPIITENMAFTSANVAKETTKEGRKRAIMDGVMKMYTPVANAMKSVTSKIPSDIKTEMAQEGTEQLFGEAAKQLQNVAFGDEKNKKGFMSLNDPEFTKKFYQEMGMSVVMGGLGGAMSSQAIKLFNKGRNNEDKTSVTNLVLSGQTEDYIKLITNLRNTKNGLGSDNLSTEFDNSVGSFKPMSDGAVSHNEANYRLLLNEVNAIQQIIKGIGSKKALDIIKNDPDFKDQKLAGTAIRDVQSLTKKYLDIVAASPGLTEAALDANMKFESPEKESEYFKGLATTYNTTEENIKELINIKKSLHDITTGLKTEEYVFNNLMKLEKLEKFGDNFTGNLFQALKVKQKEREEEAKDLKDIAEKSQVAAEGLKDDLSNLDEITDFKVATNKAKKILAKKLKDYRLDASELGKFTEKITEQYLSKNEDGSYINEEVNKELLFVARQMALNDTSESDITKKLADNFKLLSEIHDSYYNTRLENLSKDGSKSVLENIANFRPISFKGKPTVDANGNSQFSSKQIEFLINNTSKDVKSIVQEFISIESENFPVNAKYSKLSIADPDILAVIKDASDKIKKANQFTEVAKDESYIQSLTENFDYIWEEITGDGDKVSVGNSFYNRLHGDTSIHETVKSKNNDGVNLFDDISSTKNLLEQVRLKQSLMRGIIKYHKNFSDYRSSFTRLMETLDTKDSRNVKDILNVFNTTYVSSDSMKNFSDVIFDSRKLQLLRKKYKGTIEDYKAKYNELNKKVDALVQEQNIAEMSEDFDRIDEIQTEVDKVYNEINKLKGSHENEIGDLLYLEEVKKRVGDALVDLNENEKLLESYLVTAEGNQTIDNKLKNRMNGTANSVKSNMQKTNDFLDLIVNNIDTRDLIDRNDPRVKEFLDYYKGKFDSDSKSAEVLKEDNTVLYKFYDYLRTTTKKDNINSALYFYFSTNFSNNGDHDPAFNRLLIASQFDIIEFNKKFDAISKDSPHLAYSEQEEVALTAAAHINTNISNLYLAFRQAKDIADKKKYGKDYSKSDITIRSDDVMTLFGNAGSGKSTFGIGLGLSIGLDIRGKDQKVFFASNTQPQLGTLKETAVNFGFKGKVLKTEVFEDLLNYLQTAVENKLNKKELSELSLIVFDEATVQSANIKDKNNQASSPHSINQILHLVSELNKTRNDNDRIKVILSGDPKQNGYTEIGEDTGGLMVTERNIGVDRDALFGTAYLDLNIRSKVQAITDIASTIKTGRYHEGEIVGNNKVSDKFKSVYGTYVATNTKLGVQFTTEEDDMFNNDELIDNIEANIKANPNFKVGIVGNDIDTKGRRVTEKGDSKLDKLILANPNTFVFEFYSHDNVQGQTFDYTIATMDKPSFYDNNSVWLTKRSGELYIAKKLATTIERSNFFTLIVNKTDRRFESRIDENLSIVSAKLENAVISDVKEFLFKTRPDSETAVEPILENEPTQDKAEEALKVLEILTTETELSPEQEVILANNPVLKVDLMNTEGSQEKIEEVIEKILDEPVLELEEVSITPTEQEVINEGIISELEKDEVAVDVQKALFSDAGLISASFTGEMLEEADEKFTKHVIKSFVNKHFVDFDYTLKVSEHTESGITFKKVFIKIANKSGVFTSMKVFTNEETSKQFDISHNDKVISVKNMQSIINNVTSGKVNSKDKANVPLTEFKESLKKQGLSVSDNIYVLTAGDNRGDTFILVSQQSDIDLDKNMSVDDQSANTTVFDTMKSLKRNIRRFKNSTAMIMLNSKPLSKFSDLYDKYMKIMEAGAQNKAGGKYVNNFTGSRKNSINIVEFLALFLEEYGGYTNYDTITSGIKGTAKGENLVNKISKLDKKKYLGAVTFLNRLMSGSIGLETLTQDKLFIYYFDKELGKTKSIINFDLFLKSVNKALEEEPNFKEILDELFEVGLPKGFYARFKAFKTKTNKNTLFAALDRESVENLEEGIKFNIDDNYTVNVNPENSLSTPIVYINYSELLNTLNSKAVKVTTKIVKVSTAEIKTMISGLNTTDSSSEMYQNIKTKIGSSVDKKTLGKLFSDRVKELNKPAIDRVLVPVGSLSVYEAPNFNLVNEFGKTEFGNKEYDTASDSQLNDLFNDLLSELNNLNIKNINIPEIEKLMEFANRIANSIDATNENAKLLLDKIQEVNNSLVDTKIYAEVFPIFNSNKQKFITKELSIELKNKILGLEYTTNFPENIDKFGLESIENKFEPIELIAIEKYLSSLKDCN